MEKMTGFSRSDPTTVPVPGSFRSAPVRWLFWISGMRIWRNRRRHGEKGNICLIRGELPKADAESLGWKECKGKERAAEELDALYKAGFDYVILPSMLSATEKSGAADLLERAASLVRPGGKLLAAAENESGVRYFMGAEPFEHLPRGWIFRACFEDLKRNYGTGQCPTIRFRTTVTR